MATLARIIERAQGVIGEVAGPGVQVHAEDRMLNDAVSAFNMVFIKIAWPQYTQWSRHELDGTTGQFTGATNLSNVKDFTDILRVVRDGEEKPISILPSSLNPYSLGVGTRPSFWTGLAATNANYATKKLQFYPITATGFVNVRARVYPSMDPLTPADEVHLDEDMLVFATAFFTLAFEDLNVGAADTCKALFEGRYKDILASLAGHLSSLGSGAAPMNDWTQVP